MENRTLNGSEDSPEIIRGRPLAAGQRSRLRARLRRGKQKSGISSQMGRPARVASEFNMSGSAGLDHAAEAVLQRLCGVVNGRLMQLADALNASA